MSLSAGDKLGPYEIHAPIGAGGMGEVYKARDTRLGRTVAIKTSKDQFSERFEREARAVAALNHPNTCQIYDVGPNYLVMEFIEGESPKGPMPLDEALRIAGQIADGLEAAHEKGIVHRDLKPANIKVTPDGAVKVLDFGLAKMTAPEAASAPMKDSPTITMVAATQAGMILGTAGYMSPEQARGKSATTRADIWAFGVVLYELLTGHSPFKGEDVTEMLASIVRDQVDLSVLPHEVRRLCDACLQKDPRKRLQAIGDWKLLLDRPLSLAMAAALPPKRRASWLWPAIAGAFALAAAAFAFLWLRPAPLPEAVRFEIRAAAGSALPLGAPAISPDGRTIAYTVADPDGKRRIHLRPIDSVETRALPGTEGGMHPFWSPDGRSLAFATNNILKRIDLTGGAPRDLASVTGPWHGAWGRNGDILTQGPAGMQRVSQDGGPVTQIAGGASGHPFFLPDGKRFLVWTGLNHGSIQLATLGSRDHSMVLDDVDSTGILAETPRGKTYLLFLRDSDLFAQEFDPRAGVLRGSSALVASGVGRVANPRVKPAVGASRAGILAYQMGNVTVVGQLTWFDRSGKPQGALPAEVSGQGVDLSPDGSSVAMSRVDQSGNEDVWLTDIERKSSTRLSFSKARDVSPVWSPDANRVAFVEMGGGQPKIYIVDAHDAGNKQNIRISADSPESWSPDGKSLLVGSNGGLSLIPVTGTDEPIKAGSANGSSSEGRFSPDGRFIAFVSDQSGRQEVYVQRAPPASGEWKISIDGGSAPRWRKDGRELFFISATGAMMAVDVKPGENFSAGIPHQLFAVEGVNVADYDVRADGKQFLVFVPQRQKQDFPITVVLNWWAELGK